MVRKPFDTDVDPARPETGPVSVPQPMRPAPAPLGAVAAAIEARILELEAQGFSVRGVTPLDTKNNLEQLRRQRPELFGIRSVRTATKSR